MIRNIVPGVLAVVCFLAVPLNRARAEVYECDGKWTNKPCSGAVTKSIEETGSSAPVDPNIKAIREKTSLLHELRMSVFRARDDFGLHLDIADVEDFCLKQPSSPDDCRAKVSERQAEVDARVASASVVAAQERSVRLQEEANRIQEERNNIEANKPTINVIQEERRFIDIPNDRLRPRPGVPPRRDQGVVIFDGNGNAKKIEGVKPGPFAPVKPPEGKDSTQKCH